MTRLPSIQPRAKSSALLKDVLLYNTLSPPRPTFPRDFKRLWVYLKEARASFKSSGFHYDFFNLLPHPFHLSGNYFRLQARTFIYWYEFSARQYNISFDFGVKQKKTVMENAVWRRPTRRGQRPLEGWWTYISRFPTYGRKNKASSFFCLNANGQQPSFQGISSVALPWFEENLPLLRRLAWSYYSRLMPYVSNFAILSQSLFEERLLYRKAPLDATTLWLASPVHDYSAFVKSYTDNKSLILPERFFQYRRHRQRLVKIWSAASGRLWSHVVTPVVVCPLAFPFLDGLLFYSRMRILTSTLSFFNPKEITVVRSVFTPTMTRLPFSWVSRILPAVTRSRRSKRFMFFLRRSFFLRHLRNRLHRDPKILSFSYHYFHQIKQLHRFFTQWFQLYSFNGSIMRHWFLWFIYRLLQQRRLAANKKLVIGQLDADYVRRAWKPRKKKYRRR